MAPIVCGDMGKWLYSHSLLVKMCFIITFLENNLGISIKIEIYTQQFTPETQPP